MENSGLADYAVFKLLLEFDEEKNGYVTRARFYKAMFELHRRLKRRRIDIRLPWRWYIYGPVVEMDYVSPEVYSVSLGQSSDYETNQFAFEFKTYLFYGSRPGCNHCEPQAVAAIDYEVKKLRDEWLSTKDLVNIAYSHAPLPFMSVLREFDDTMNSVLGTDSLANLDRYEFRTLSGRMISKFPRDCFPEMYGPCLRLVDLVGHLIEASAGVVNKEAEISSEFRRIMALGFSSRYFENIPESRIELYEGKYHENVERFDCMLFEKERMFFSSSDKEITSQSRELKALLDASYSLLKEV